MPLLYYARQSQLKTKDGVKQWHLTLKKVGRAVSLQQLGEMVAEKCSATPGDVHNVIRNLMSVMRMQLLNSRTVRLDGLGTFTVIARTRGKGVDKEKDVNPNQVTSLHFMFTPEYTRPAVWSLKSGRVELLLMEMKVPMMVTEEMPVVTEASMRIHLGKWRIESWGCAVHLLLKHKVINMKKAVLNKILKIVIAVASAILGALGANAMNMR